jgi:enoyl-CoA hydratase
MSATIEMADGVAIITMDDGKANALNPAMLLALNHCLDRAELEAKAIALVGREQRFSAGFDLAVLASATPSASRNLVRDGGRLAARLYGCPVPVVAACTGHAIAMGSLLLLSCDIRIGAKGPFKIGTNETAIKMNLPTFAIELLKARISPRHLTEAAINGHLYGPEGAESAGFLDASVAADDVIHAAISRARDLEVLAGPHFAANKNRIREHTLKILQQSLKD